MNRWMRRSAVARSLLAATAAVLLGKHLAQGRAERKSALAVQPVAYRSDGRTLVEDGKGLLIAGPHLTAANPAIAAYKEVDWVSSSGHGVAPGGRRLRVTPSEDCNRLTKHDLTALAACVRQLPATPGRRTRRRSAAVAARVLYGFGVLQDASKKIDHRLPRATPWPNARPNAKPNERPLNMAVMSRRGGAAATALDEVAGKCPARRRTGSQQPGWPVAMVQ